MKIGIDLHTLNNFMQGSRTYAANITRSLLEMDRFNEYYLYVTENRSECETIFQQKNVKIKTIRPATRFLRIPIGFPVKLAMHGVDIFHCQYIGPVYCPCPYVVSLHDIIHETMPELYPRISRTLMSLFYPLSARLAAKVLTISEHTKRQLIKIYNIPAEKIEVIYCGASSEFRVIEDRSKIRATAEKYGVRGPYILFVGRIEPRKNINGLVRGYRLLKAAGKTDRKLVIAGMKDPQFKDFQTTIDDLGLKNDVVLAGRVDQEDLPYLYNGADLFVYPSFAEGFGLPPLEAMSCGVPVITSNTTSLPEVVGDAGIMISPTDIQSLAEAMEGVLTNDDLRRNLRKKGLDRASRFSWLRASRQTLQVYKNVAGRKKS